MTTVALQYESRTISYDSRMSSGNGYVVDDNYNKKREVNGVVFFLAGVAADIDMFTEYYPGPYELIPECSGILVRDGEVHSVHVDEHGMISELNLTCDYAVGSGEQFALAAMDLGKTSKEAVKYATTRDCFSGGKINTFKF